MEPLPDFCIDISDTTTFLETGILACDGTSTDSSPSPVMIFSNMENMNYDAFPGSPTSYSLLESHPTSPMVEFTDLTVPYNEDRRRRRSHVIRDKQTLSTMHMRRRAQNRASQRAFRERKEKHAQDLQHQLDELESKHKALQESYEKLRGTNAKIAEELEQLRDKIGSLELCRNKNFDDMMASELLEPFDFDRSP
ncbi:hypothetical protein MMC14_007454 [Varicellaria rhodocarpa]|nr:hypothetical protein [Varicellaria rhodocarpa]